MDDVNFQTLLNEKLREHGISIKKLSELTGIAVKHLENLSAGRFDALPAAPYLRGYLIEIGEVLGFDGEACLDYFKEEGYLKGSGAHDELPRNRFAQKPLNKKIIVGLVLAVVFLYFGIRLSKILGTPRLQISSPREETVTVHNEQFLLEGEIQDGNQLTINDEPITIDAAGHWQKSIPLQPGLNPVRIVAKKFLGRETEATRQIIYEPPATSTPTNQSSTNAL